MPGIPGSFSAGEQYTLPIDARSFRTVSFPWQELLSGPGSAYDGEVRGWRLFPEMFTAQTRREIGNLGFVVDIHFLARHTITGSGTGYGYALWEWGTIQQAGLTIESQSTWTPLDQGFAFITDNQVDGVTRTGETIFEIYREATNVRLIWHDPILQVYPAGYSYTAYVGFIVRYIPYQIFKPRMHV